MTTNAWVFMLSVWTIVVLATIYCFAKLLRKDHLMEFDEEGNRVEPWGDPIDSSSSPSNPGA